MLSLNVLGPTYLEVKGQFSSAWSGRFYLSTFHMCTIDAEKKKEQSLFLSLVVCASITV